MCDTVKDFQLLEKQYLRAIEEDIEIIEIEFISGKVRYRDRWSVGKIIKDSAENLDMIKNKLSTSKGRE